MNLEQPFDIDKVYTWPMFEASDICDRIIAAPAYPVPTLWLNQRPPYYPWRRVNECKVCDVATTEDECWMCGTPFPVQTYPLATAYSEDLEE